MSHAYAGVASFPANITLVDNGDDVNEDAWNQGFTPLADRTQWAKAEIEKRAPVFASLADMQAARVAGTLTDGDLAWLNPAPVAPLQLGWDYATAATANAVVGDAEGVYIGAGDNVAKLSRAGSSAWSATPNPTHAIVALAAPGPRLFFACADRTVGELDISTGATLWSQTVGSSGSLVDLCSDGEALYALLDKSGDADVVAYDVDGGPGDGGAGQLWLATVGGSGGDWNAIATDGARVYLAGGEAVGEGLHARLASDGSAAWGPINTTSEALAIAVDHELVYGVGLFGIRAVSPVDGSTVWTKSGTRSLVATDGRTVLTDNSTGQIVELHERRGGGLLEAFSHGAILKALDADGDRFWAAGTASSTKTVRSLTTNYGPRAFRVTDGSRYRRPVHKTLVPVP